MKINKTLILLALAIYTCDKPKQSSTAELVSLLNPNTPNMKYIRHQIDDGNSWETWSTKEFSVTISKGRLKVSAWHPATQEMNRNPGYTTYETTVADVDLDGRVDAGAWPTAPEDKTPQYYTRSTGDGLEYEQKWQAELDSNVKRIISIIKGSPETEKANKD